MFIRNSIIFIGFLILIDLNGLNAQSSNFNGGGSLGLSATLGTKVKRIGFFLGGFIVMDQIQFNTYFNRFYCFNSYGPHSKRLENVLNVGITGAFGPPTIQSVNERNFFSPISNFTNKRHSISYVYKIYTDNISTSQNSGIIGFQTGNIQFYAENDLFIFKGSDKYRTGAFSLIYQYFKTQIGLTCLLWTGNNNDKETIKILKGENHEYSSKFGYYDLSETKYGRYSHGIIALQAAYALPLMQSLNVQAGIDAEQIRHAFQNKILHDLPFIPNKWNKSINPHFPMLDEEGKPFLYKKGQKIREPKFHGSASLNPVLLY